MHLKRSGNARKKFVKYNIYCIDLMQQYHYFGSLPKIGRTIWCVATCNNEWLGLLSFTTAVLKCSTCDRWIGWGHRLQYDRLHLVANNSRFRFFRMKRTSQYSSVLQGCGEAKKL